MVILDAVRSLFGRKKTIDQVTGEQLRREKIRIEQVEARAIREVEAFEERKESLFLKGKDEPSQRQQIIIARKIKELDAQAKAKDKQLALVSRHLRAINGFVQLKENKKLVEEMGVGSVLSNMDLDELQVYVENATVEGELQLDRFGQLVQALEHGHGVTDGVEEEPDTFVIVEAMREAKAAEGVDTEAARHGLEKVERVLAQASKREEPEVAEHDG